MKTSFMGLQNLGHTIRGIFMIQPVRVRVDAVDFYMLKIILRLKSIGKDYYIVSRIVSYRIVSTSWKCLLM